MHTNEKRLFLGNLPPGITEDDIVKKFNKFGNVKSVEIKHRPDSSTFAFLNFEANTETLNSCFHSITKKKWNGYSIKLEVAKESFLSKLQQERQNDKQNSCLIEESRITMKRPRENFESKTKKKTKQNSDSCTVSDNSSHSDSTSEKEEEDDDDDDEEEEKCKWKLKRFQGTKHVSCENDTSMSDTKGPITLKNSGGLLERLESFSSTWKDSQIIYESNKHNKREREENSPKDSKTKKDIRIKNSMLNETSVISKNLLAEEKRKKALEEKMKVLLKQKEAVKMALTSMDSTQKNRKIFHDDYEESIDKNTTHGVLVTPSDAKIQQKAAKKTVLFGDSSDDDGGDDTSFKIKSQFEGSEGRKLLELQSRYGNDKRFTLDEKFYESEDDDSKPATDKVERHDIDDERNQQLAILQDVLGHLIPLTEEKRVPKSKQMLRFDPTKVEHTKFEKETSSKKETVSNKETIEVKSKNKSRKEVKLVENDVSIPVSKEKFYKVADNLKESLQKKEEQSTFSIRELFGRSEEGLEEEEERNDIYSDITLKKQTQIGWTSNPFKYDSSDDEERDDEKAKVSSDVTVNDNVPQQNQTHFGENFFFMSNDPRLQEGLDFFNKNDVKEESHDFAKYRRELKQCIRLKVKNNLRSHSKFKKKIGLQKRKMLRRKQ